MDALFRGKSGRNKVNGKLSISVTRTSFVGEPENNGENNSGSSRPADDTTESAAPPGVMFAKCIFQFAGADIASDVTGVTLQGLKSMWYPIAAPPRITHEWQSCGRTASTRHRAASVFSVLDRQNRRMLATCVR